MGKYRYRIKFQKTEQMRYTGNLDLLLALERSFRRAQLPLLYSQGYNPRPRINLASALPLGAISQGEIADIWFEDQIDEQIIKKALEKALPPGLRILMVESVDLRAATLQMTLLSAEYLITFLENFPALADALEKLGAQEEIMRVRRGKSYNLRPLIEDLVLLPLDENGLQKISVRLSSQQGATGRPDEVIEALGYAFQLTRIQRERLIFIDEEK
jgi:radical SAM-linked protein